MKRGRKCHGYGEEYNRKKKDKGKQFHLYDNIVPVRKNIKWERREEAKKFWKENQNLKKLGGEEYQIEGT